MRGRLDVGGVELVELGYVVEDPVEVSEKPFYFAAAQLQSSERGYVTYFSLRDAHGRRGLTRDRGGRKSVNARFSCGRRRGTFATHHAGPDIERRVLGCDPVRMKRERTGRRRAALGRRGESLAAEFLLRRRMRIVERNYSCPAGEIDLIALDGDTLVFVEVKLRRGAFDPFEAVDARKQAQVSRAAFDYMRRRGLYDRPARFDVVAVDGETGECRHVLDAFDSALDY